jgi:probable rRNA maturation factor
MIEVSIANEQPAEVDEPRLRLAIERVMAAEREGSATISLAIVDNAAIHALNRQFLEHDYPTDVLSFVLEDRGQLEGEIVVSAEMAASEAARFGWTPADELLLYVIHGALHLVGYDDLEPEAAERMRAAEARHLAAFGLSGR